MLNKQFHAFIRHSERADQHYDPSIAIEEDYDPPLTTNGRNIAFKTG